MENDTIELRSPKVREIIGQIPSILIRLGITLFFVFIILLILGSKYFNMPYIIKAKTDIIEQDSNVLINVYIPANEYKNIEPGQYATIFLDNIANLHNEKIEIPIQKTGNEIVVKNEVGYIKNSFTYTLPLLTNNNKIFSATTVKLRTEIFAGEISFFDQVFNSKKTNQ